LSQAQDYIDAEAASQEHAYVLALFDALIESGRNVPADLLRPFATRWRDEVIILLCRSTENEDDLLNMRAEPLNEAQWLAVGNSLLKLRSSKFFVRTLEQTHVTHKFIVVSEEAGGFGGGSGGGGVSDGSRQLPKGFPPIGLYQLVTFPAEGYALVAKGPRNVYFRRTVVPTNRQVVWGTPFGSCEKDEEQLEYLAAMTQTSIVNVSGIFSPSTTIQWRTEDDFLSRSMAALSGQSTAIQAFVETARQRGLKGLADLKLTGFPILDDRRHSTIEALPKLPTMNIAVQ
jgi:hypothetical protein